MNLLPSFFLAANSVPADADAMTRLVTDHADKPGVKEILFAILFSFALNALVAWTYKRTYRGTRYSQDYVHTLLILGTVVTLVILVVMGNLATAFGMFAAFSIIRFRRNVGQSRDIGFIFLAMATGLAVGARQYLLAGVTVPLVCAFVFLLSRANLFSSFKKGFYGPTKLDGIGPSRKKFSMLDVSDSATRWLDYLYNNWPFTAMTLAQLHQHFTKVG